MKPHPAIPQHDLQKRFGTIADFELLTWGEETQQYDFEKPHRHNFYEIIVVYKGGGTHDIDFTTHSIRSRSVHFVRPDHVHLLLRNKNAKGCSLQFTGDLIAHELAQKLPFGGTAPILSLSKDEFEHVKKLVDLIAEEYKNRQTGYEKVIHAHMQALVLSLLRVRQPIQECTVTKPELIIQFTQLVQKFYSQHYTVAQYAQKLNVSVKHLIALCKTYTGRTPLQYINQYMITEAKRLLFHTQLTIKEIAYKLGFDEPTNFSKYFKSATGYTPVAYREGIR